MPSNIGKGYIWFFSQKKLCLARKKDKLIFRREKNMKNYSSLDLFLRLGVLIYLIHAFFQIWKEKKIFCNYYWAKPVLENEKKIQSSITFYYLLKNGSSLHIKVSKKSKKINEKETLFSTALCVSKQLAT